MRSRKIISSASTKDDLPLPFSPKRTTDLPSNGTLRSERIPRQFATSRRWMRTMHGPRRTAGLKYLLHGRTTVLQQVCEGIANRLRDLGIARDPIANPVANLPL